VGSDLASPLWQNAILYGSALFLLWEIFGGWRRGVIRAGLHFGAFVASGFLGLLAGQGVASLIGILMPGISFLAGLVVGSVVALLVLGICLFLSAVLFKRTSQQPPGLVRWLFGAGGAVFGLLTGLFILWSGITLIRAAGAIAQSAPSASGFSKNLVDLKRSLEKGPLGGLIESIDILPTETYDRIVRLGELSKNPDAMISALRKIETHGAIPDMPSRMHAFFIESPARRPETVGRQRRLHAMQPMVRLAMGASATPRVGGPHVAHFMYLTCYRHFCFLAVGATKHETVCFSPSSFFL